jgi:hypothetical protein
LPSSRRAGTRRNPGKDPEILKQMGLLFSAGLIAGEALIGVLIAIPIAATKNADVLAVAGEHAAGQWAGLAALGLIGWWMYIVSTKTGEALIEATLPAVALPLPWRSSTSSGARATSRPRSW